MWRFLRNECNGLELLDFIELERKFRSHAKWDYFALTELKSFLTEDLHLLSDKHLNYIIEKCNQMKLDFENGTVVKIGDTWWYLEALFISFYKKLRFVKNKAILTKIFWWDNHGIYRDRVNSPAKMLSELLIEDIEDIELVKTIVLANLYNGISISNVLGTHFRLCNSLAISESRGILKKYILEETLGDVGNKKGVKIYINLGGNIKDFKNIISTFDTTKYWHWDIIDQLFKKVKGTRVQITKLIEGIVLNDNCEEIQKEIALDILLKSKRESGLVMLKELIDRSRVSHFRIKEEFTNSLINYKFGLIKNLLSNTFHKAIKYRNHSNGMLDFVSEVLLKGSIKDEEVFFFAKGLYEPFKNETHVRKAWEDLEDNYWLKKQVFESVEEVNCFLKEVYA